jgi:sodium/potassium-transporting ATPase subunit alpha
MAIAQQVGIITNPISAVKHLDDLPKDMPIEDVPLFNPNKEPGDDVSSLVLSGSEMVTMTESQWAQVLAVRSGVIFSRVFLMDIALTV